MKGAFSNEMVLFIVKLFMQAEKKNCKKCGAN